MREVGVNVLGIKRARFHTPEPLPRRTRTEKQATAAITLSDATLEKLLSVSMADKNDRAWLAQKAKYLKQNPRATDLMLESFIGRKQLTITSMVSLSQAALKSSSDQLALIRAANSQGRIDMRLASSN